MTNLRRVHQASVVGRYEILDVCGSAWLQNADVICVRPGPASWWFRAGDPPLQRLTLRQQRNVGLIDGGHVINSCERNTIDDQDRRFVTSSVV